MTDTIAPPRPAVIGDNNPPVDAYDAHATHIDDLYIEAGNWADGEDIANQDQADEVDRLIADFKAAIEAAETSRDDEKKPYADKVKEIQERYYPLIGETKAITGKAIRAKKALLAVKTKWANKVAAEQAAKAEALRREAMEQAQQAAAAARAAAGNRECGRSDPRRPTNAEGRDTGRKADCQGDARQLGHQGPDAGRERRRDHHDGR